MKWPLALFAVFIALTAAGGRDATATLAGIHAGPGSVALGVAYVSMWFVVVLVVPVWVLAHGIARVGLVPRESKRRHSVGEGSVCDACAPRSDPDALHRGGL